VNIAGLVNKAFIKGSRKNLGRKTVSLPVMYWIVKIFLFWISCFPSDGHSSAWKSLNSWTLSVWVHTPLASSQRHITAGLQADISISWWHSAWTTSRRRNSTKGDI